MEYILLDSINSPSDLKQLQIDELPILGEEIRSFLIEKISKIGGHLGAALGVIELTLALYYVFDVPNDKLVWDTGHQSHIHKILTGRRDKICSMKQSNGISGFCVRSESEYDIFGAGHTSTSISAICGIMVGQKFKKEKHEIIGIIGDSAMSAGIAYEGMNNIRNINERAIIVLNDNGMSISNGIGGMHKYLSSINQIKSEKNKIKTLIHTENKDPFQDIFGVKKIGAFDGHDLLELINLFQEIRDTDFTFPLCVHIKTEKGNGYKPAQRSLEKFHSTGPFSIITGESINVPKTYTDVFADTIIGAMSHDDKIVSVTAAMLSGTGLDRVKNVFPDRVWDVAISEQHAVTFCGGMAASGLKPFCAIYSTFLQRGYDQIIHDIAIQSLPVRFAIDRAGVVGNDGQTHHGLFDIAFLRILPNFLIMAPSDELSLVRSIKTSLSIDDQPSAFRYPRGVISGQIELNYDNVKPFKIGQSKIILDGNDIAILCCGQVLYYALEAAKILAEKYNINPLVLDARFIVPLDTNTLSNIAKHFPKIITVEDGTIGGYGSVVLEYLSSIDYKGMVRTLLHQRKLISHDTISNLHKYSNIDTAGIVNTVREISLS